MKKNAINLLLLTFLLILNISVSAKDFYWIGGSGNFNDISHWSDQPGGKVNPDAVLPGIEDNVFFDEFSFTELGQAVTITGVARCKNMHWGNVQFNPTFTSDDNPAHYLVIYGGLTFSNSMILDLDKPIYFRASTEGNVINFNGNTFQSDLYFENKGGWRITKDIDLGDKAIYFKQGSLSVEADISCGQFISDNMVSRKLFLNDSEIRLNKADEDVFRINSQNFNIDPGTSKILVESDGSKIKNTADEPLELHDVIFNGDRGGIVSEGTSQTRFNIVIYTKNGELTGNNVFQELTFTEGYKYFIYSGGQQDIRGTFNAMGKCYAFITIESEHFGGDVTAAATNFDYLKVKNIRAAGAAVDFVATNSYDLGGNSNWNITPPNTLDYLWTGADGDNLWGNHKNWDQNCVPSRNNNVNIPPGANVIVNIPAECNDIFIDNTASFLGSEELNVFGSLTAGTANWTYNGELIFTGNTDNNISIDVDLPGKVKFEGTGTCNLTSAFKTSNSIEFLSGTLRLHGNKLTCGTFVSDARTTRTLRMEGSEIEILDGVEKAWNVSGSKFNLIDDVGSEIKLVKASSEFYNNSLDGVAYNKVTFEANTGQVSLTNEGTGLPTFQEVRFEGNASIKGNHQYNNLFLGESKEYLLQAGSEQKILDVNGFVAKGTCASYINLKGDGGIAYIFSDVSTSEVEFARIENVNVRGGIIGTGGLTAEKSFGVSGYEGWKFTMAAGPGKEVKWEGNVDNNWFNGANWDTGCIPTRLDDVIVDNANLKGAAVNVIRIAALSNVAECRDMIWQNADLLSFEGDQPLNIFGSVDLQGMRADAYTFSGDIIFKSEEIDETIDLGTIELLNNLRFVGTEDEDGDWNAGLWTINSDLKTTGTLTLEYGGIMAVNKNIEVKHLLSNFDNTHARILNVERSNITLEKVEISAFGIDFSASQSLISLKNESKLAVTTGDRTIAFNDIIFEKETDNSYIEVQSDNVSFNQISCKGNTYFRAMNPSNEAMTIQKIKMAVGKSYSFEANKIFTVGEIEANGACEGTIDINALGEDQTTLKAVAGVANIIVNSVNILNVKAEPAGKFIARTSLDLGNNTGWVFESTPTGKDLYWVGGTGFWDDPSHWSTTSGGVADGCVPTAKDNVYFDANSFTAFRQTVYTGVSDIRCKNMDWSGSEATLPNFEVGSVDISGIYIYGSLYLNSTVNVNLAPVTDFYFRGTETCEIKSFGYIFPDRIIFDGNSGSWTLLDDFQTEGDLYIELGKLNVNGNLLEANSINSYNRPVGENSRGLNIANSQVVINGVDPDFTESFNITLMDYTYLQGFELIADNSTIRFTTEASVTIIGSLINESILNELIFEDNAMLSSGTQPNVPYYKKVHFKADGKIIGENKFGTLQIDRGGELTLGAKEKYKMEYFIAEGTCFGPIQIHSDEDGKKSTIQAENDVNINFVELKDITGDLSIGTTYTAINSFDLGNVSGWNVDGNIAPISLYWTGNGADDKWDNYQNWSRSEDGSEEGCVPTINDDVFFTINSFLGSKNVEITAEAFCHNITWNDDINSEATFKVDAKLNIAGSMDLTNSMVLTMNNAFSFIGDGEADVKNVDFADRSMNGDIIFNGDNQTWQWESGLVTTGDLYIEKGTVNTNRNNFTINRLISVPTGNVNFTITESSITVGSDVEKGWYIKKDPTYNYQIATDLSQITFPNGGEFYCEVDGDINLNDIIFDDNGVLKIVGTGKGNFGSVLFNEQGQVFGNNEFKVLKFTLGYEHNSIEAEKTVTVTDELKMEGIRCAYVFLESSEAGKIAFIKKPTGVWDGIYNAVFTDIQASSGGGDHPVYYHLEGANYTGFTLVDDGDTSKNPPSFEDEIEQEQWCHNYAVLDKVESFPINSKTTYSWERADIKPDGTPDIYADIAETASTITVTESGYYRVTISYGTDAYNVDCFLTSTFKVVLNEKSDIKLAIDKGNIVCFGSDDAYIKVEVEKPDRPDYTYTWRDEDGTLLTHTEFPATGKSNMYGLSPGKYYISVTDAKTCTKDTIVDVFNAYEIKYSIETEPLRCFNQPEGEILIDGTGGTGNLYYYMDDAQQASNHITDLYSGDYEIYLKDDSDCISERKTATITSNPEILVEMNPVDLDCNGEANGKFTPEVTGGVPSYTYYWTGPAGFTPSTSKDLTGLSGGEYYLQVRDYLGCELTKPHTLIEPGSILTKELIVEDIRCNGENNGEIFVVASNGKGDYRYILNGIENSTGKFTNLTPNNYHLQIIDENNCSLEKDITISEPGNIFFFADFTKPTCELITDGEILVTAEGGNGAYQYSWSGPNDYRSNNKNIDNLEAGKYILTITDKKHCSGVDTVDLDLGAPIQLGVVVEDHVSKPGAKDGKLAIEIVGGTSPYTFTIQGPGIEVNNPDHFDDNNYLQENLPGGVYTVTASDSKSCNTVKRSVIIKEGDNLYAYINELGVVNCDGLTAGKLGVMSNVPSASYSWTGPGGYTANSKVISNLGAGTYEVTVSNKSQTAIVSYELEVAPGLTVNSSSQDVTCYNEANGEADLLIDSGGDEYSILWTGDDGFLSTARHINHLQPGTYSYRVETTRGCSAEGSLTISQPTQMTLNIIPGDISSAGERDGTIRVEVAEGTPPYSIMVSGPGGDSYTDMDNTSGVFEVPDLRMGMFEASVFDANGCNITGVTKIHEPTKMLVFLDEKDNVICPGGDNGRIKVKVIGASAEDNLIFTWEGPNFYRSNDLYEISNLKAGQYTLNVVDTHGDPKYDDQTITIIVEEPEPLRIEYWKKDISCTGKSDGYINIYPLGGTPEYTYQWAGIGVVTNEEDQTGLDLGTYSVKITDANGCVSDPLTVEIEEPSMIQVAILDMKEPTCYGYEDGFISLGISEGKAPYSIYWDNYGSVTTTISEIEKGDYHYIVKDDNGCETGYTINLNEPDTLIAQVENVVNVKCHGAKSGSAEVMIQGGTPGYDIVWSDTQNTKIASNLNLGEYEVEVIDANGCRDTSSVKIKEPDVISAEIEVLRPTTIDSADGEIAVEVSGGVETYDLSWLDEEENLYTGANLTDLKRGIYALTVTDINDCKLDTVVRLEYLFEKRIRIPKAFTPNGDGYNDYWDIERIEFIQDLKIVIYDRMGKSVYQFSGTGNEYRGTPWKGVDGSTHLPVGSYYYAVELDDEKPIIGTVTILR